MSALRGGGEAKDSQASRVSVIKAVQHPLGFFTLGLLILQTNGAEFLQ